MTKKKEILLGIVFLICLVLTFVFRHLMDNQNLEFEEVNVVVLSADEDNVRIKTGYSSTNISDYDVQVSYKGKTYDLHNVHSLSGYWEGSTVKAYLSGDSMYANVEGVNTSTPVAYAYYVCLIGSFVLLILFLSFIQCLFKKSSRNTF